jgi:hypothetical protein
MEKSADDDQRMGAEDIHHDTGAEYGEVVRADDQVVVSGQETRYSSSWLWKKPQTWPNRRAAASGNRTVVVDSSISPFSSR